jgi:NADPH-dependent glutamate synthase beta subunit-like oxidoreductase
LNNEDIRNMSKSALVIGGTLEGISAAMELADAGIRTFLLEGASCLGEKRRSLRNPPGRPVKNAVTIGDEDYSRFMEVLSHPNIEVLTNSRITFLGGEAGDFTARITRRPRFVREERCSGCGKCSRECLVTFNNRKAIDLPFPEALPQVYSVEKRGTPPCKAACPAGVSAQGYIALIREGRFEEALLLEREKNPLAAVSGRICTAPCEDGCIRREVDGPISICALKRFIADMEMKKGPVRPRTPGDRKGSSGHKMAVVGSGPAGLTCAYYLAGLGHEVTIFEKSPSRGGMLVAGVPSYKLPRDVLEWEISFIEAQGVEIRTSVEVGRDQAIEDLFKEGYKAVFLALGAHQVSSHPALSGSEMTEGLIDGLTFLQEVNLQGRREVPARVLVVGEGWYALDIARCARRMGAREVIILYPRGRDDEIGHPKDVAAAEAEKIEIRYLVSPSRLLGEGGRVMGLECLKNIQGEQDEDGRFRPEPVEGSEFIIEGDLVIAALERYPQTGWLKESGILLHEDGRIVVDPGTMATRRPGVFAGGEAVNGPGSSISAVADGRRAALAIDRYVRGRSLAEEAEEAPRLISQEEQRTILDDYRKKRRDRVETRQLEYRQRISGFNEVSLGYNKHEAALEAARCMDCGICCECGRCVRACGDARAVDHSQRPEEMEIRAGAVILAVPREERFFLGKVLGLDIDTGGKVPLRDGSLRTMETAKEGIFLAFFPSAPPGGITGAGTMPSALPAPAREILVSAAAGEAMAWFSGKRLKEKNAPAPDESPVSRVGVFLCHCGGLFDEALDFEAVKNFAFGIPGVVYAAHVANACSEKGVSFIAESVKRLNLERAVLMACCEPGEKEDPGTCSYQEMRTRRKLREGVTESPGFFETVNIREGVSWVHAGKREQSSEKVMDLLKAAVSRAKIVNKNRPEVIFPEPSIVVLGASVFGCQSAMNLARQGCSVFLLDRQQDLTRRIKEIENPRARAWLEGVLGRLRDAGVSAVMPSQVQEIIGKPGGFEVRSQEWITRDLPQVVARNASFLILDGDAGGGRIISRFWKDGNIPPGIYFGGGASRTPAEEEILKLGFSVEEVFLLQAHVIASRISGMLGRGRLSAAPALFSVDPGFCRDCGTCLRICPSGAVERVKVADRKVDLEEIEAWTARIIDEKCTGCGLCSAACPSGAIKGLTCDGKEALRSLDAMLS